LPSANTFVNVLNTLTGFTYRGLPCHAIALATAGHPISSRPCRAYTSASRRTRRSRAADAQAFDIKMKLNKKKLKSGIFITWVALLFFCNCAGKPKAFSYNFRKGSPLRKHLSEDVKIELPVFTISNGKDEKKISFPIGTEIWKDKKGFGCLIVKYMDKRFAAFGSEAYSFIDINNLEVFTVVTDVIYEIDSQSDDYLIGIQRIPKNVDYLDVFGDSEYGDSYQILFIIRFDYTYVFIM
jgi:hypothetical protein